MSRKAIPDIRKRGRPAIGEGTPVLVRLRPEELEKLDVWIKKNAPEISRPEAIRTLTAKGMKR